MGVSIIMKAKGNRRFGVGLRSKKSKREARAVLEAAYDRYGCELYQYALMILANREAAEDAVQQVFGQMMTMGKRVLEIEAMDRYLRRAVRNECYRALKKRQKTEQVVGELQWKRYCGNCRRSSGKWCI